MLDRVILWLLKGSDDLRKFMVLERQVTLISGGETWKWNENGLSMTKAVEMSYRCTRGITRLWRVRTRVRVN